MAGEKDRRASDSDRLGGEGKGGIGNGQEGRRLADILHRNPHGAERQNVGDGEGELIFLDASGEVTAIAVYESRQIHARDGD